MKLYLLRHGNSASILEAKVGSDAERPLSRRGREEVQKTVRRLLERGGKPSLILHSPLRRAVETAKEAAALTDLSGGRVECFMPLSNVMSGPELFAALEKRLSGTDEALLIGHQPQLGELAAHLFEGRFALSPGGLIALERGAGKTSVLWSSNPEDLPA